MTVWSDNFDDNVLDLNKWEKLQFVTGEIYERNKRLEFIVKAPDGSAGVGVVSKDRYDLTKGKVSVYVARTPQWTDRMILLISPHKTTSSDPLELSDYYAILLESWDDNCIVWKRVGGSQTELYKASGRPSSSGLRIEIEAGQVKFFEGDTFLTYEPYELPSYECYIYIFRWACALCCVDLGWADDFYCEYCATAEEKQEAQTLLTQWMISKTTEQFISMMFMFMFIMMLVSLVSAMMGRWKYE